MPPNPYGTRALAELAVAIIDSLDIIVIRSRYELLLLWGIVQIRRLLPWENLDASLLHPVDLRVLERLRGVVGAHVRLLLLLNLPQLRLLRAHTVPINSRNQRLGLRDLLTPLEIVFGAGCLLALKFGVGRELAPLRRALRQILDPRLHDRIRRVVRPQRRHRLLLLLFPYLVRNQNARSFVIEAVLLNNAVNSLVILFFAPIWQVQLGNRGVFLLFSPNHIIQKRHLPAHWQPIILPIKNIDVLSGILFWKFWDHVALDGGHTIPFPNNSGPTLVKFTIAKSTLQSLAPNGILHHRLNILIQVHS